MYLRPTDRLCVLWSSLAKLTIQMLGGSGIIIVLASLICLLHAQAAAQQCRSKMKLVCMQALRLASDSLSRQGSFEAVLREADSAEALLKRRSQGGASPLLDITLLSHPKVFTLAIVWESAKVRPEAHKRGLCS